MENCWGKCQETFITLNPHSQKINFWKGPPNHLTLTLTHESSPATHLPNQHPTKTIKHPSNAIKHPIFQPIFQPTCQFLPIMPISPQVIQHLQVTNGAKVLNHELNVGRTKNIFHPGPVWNQGLNSQRQKQVRLLDPKVWLPWQGVSHIDGEALGVGKNQRQKCQYKWRVNHFYQ